MDGPDVDRWIAEARQGSQEALGRLLEHYRPYLLHIANQELDGRLRSKGGGSDLVQETCLEAQRIFPRFEGACGADLVAWLRGILLNRIKTFERHYQGTQKRGVDREQQIDAAVGHPANVPTPSGDLQHTERVEAVRRALAGLPEHYRQILVWREWEDLPFEEIARRLGKSMDAARMLWRRAVERLEAELGGAIDTL